MPSIAAEYLAAASSNCEARYSALPCSLRASEVQYGATTDESFCLWPSLPTPHRLSSACRSPTDRQQISDGRSGTPASRKLHATSSGSPASRTSAPMDVSQPASASAAIVAARRVAARSATARIASGDGGGSIGASASLAKGESCRGSPKSR
eukprot:scaffold10898_cov128-Isochrysis_galbana.AAC.1